MLASSATKQNSPLIVELVGPAGAGKTTLSRALSQRDDRILVGVGLQLRKGQHIPIFVGHVPLLLPTLLRRYRSSRRFTWDEIKAMVYLRAWPGVLRQQASNNTAVILLDHGPIFKLATLFAFGPDKLRSQGFEKWWNRMFKQWAQTLDIAIWLDAPDSTLVGRINSRTQGHAVKGKPQEEAYQFLARYRISYEQIFAKLAAYGGPKLLQFDTDQASIEQIADEVLTTCSLKGGR